MYWRCVSEINYEYGGGSGASRREKPVGGSEACIGRGGGGDRFCQLRTPGPQVETQTGPQVETPKYSS